MSKTVIKIENLSKIYRLGEVGTGTLSHDLNRWWKMNILGHDDPYAKIGHVNDRTAKAQKGEMVAALRDINLEVKEGEVLGIIGRNGAGKSTLLKILSRVTSPTTGSIRVKGRMASLLEVGTGFHPEMTGRENIYMNGTIMGMRRWEIDRKLEEIVEFAGVAKYLDTPVKRYSSGMTVRLGFAIAAHLEPEILIVDEVLAVGDAEFQKKAIGKMQDVSTNDGRTVLFVSHNMGSVRKLCNTGMVLNNGQCATISTADEAIDFYLSERRNVDRKDFISQLDDYRRGAVPMYSKILELGYVNSRKDNIYASNEPISIYFKIKSFINNLRVRLSGSIYTLDDTRVGVFFAKDSFNVLENQEIILELNVLNHNLSIGEYYMSFSIGNGNVTDGNIEYDIVYEVLYFEIQKLDKQSSDSVIIKWNRDWGNIIFNVQTKQV